MRQFLVTLKVIYTYRVPVEAENEGRARERAVDIQPSVVYDEKEIRFEEVTERTQEEAA